MNYRNKSFSVAVGGQAYSEGWERTFRGELQAAATEAPIAPTSPPDAPFSPVTLRCGTCGHSTYVAKREDFETHRQHTCSGRKEVAVDSKSELTSAMSEGWRALFPIAALQGALQATSAP